MKKLVSYCLSIAISLMCFLVAPAPVLAAPAADFFTTWETTVDGESITIPTTGSGYNYNVDWGDTTGSVGVTGNATHTYATAGIYTVIISGDFPRIYFQMASDPEKIRSVEHWGTRAWTSMSGAFANTNNLVINATDIPNFSAMTNASSMFMGASQLTTIPNINDWDVSTITNMASMFFGTPFNADISDWDVSNVTNMNNMFGNASEFNQDISNWNTASLTLIESMFSYAVAFNQDISSWDVSQIDSTISLFSHAAAFDQNLAAWNIANVLAMHDMFVDSGMSTTNYDATLIGWATQAVESNVTFNAIGTQYCAAWQQHATFIATYNWTILDDGIVDGDCTVTASPTLSAPLSASSHVTNVPLTISFVLPETPLPGSVRLTFTPSIGTPIVITLSDPAPTVLNTFALPLRGGFASTSEVISATASEIPAGSYTITLSYQDEIGNAAASSSVTTVTLTAPTEGTLQFHIFTDDDKNGVQGTAEDDGFSGATLTIIQGSESEEVSFDEHGDIDSSIAVGTYTLRVNVPSGYSLSGGANNFSVTITGGDTTDAGSRGIIVRAASSGGGGGSSGSSGSSFSSSFSSSSSSSSSLRTSSTSSTTPATTDDLPTPQPKEAVCLTAGTAAIQFTDIQNNNDVSYLTKLTFKSDPSRHLINGYNPLHFGPHNQLTRFELLKIAIGSNCVGGGNYTNFTHTNTHFIDVPKDNSEQSKIIGEAFSRGIVTGVGDRFFPDTPVSFAEMTKMILASSAYFNEGIPNIALTVSSTDLPDPSFAQPVEYAKRLGILPTTFAPRNPVNRVEMANVLAKYIQAMHSL